MRNGIVPSDAHLLLFIDFNQYLRHIPLEYNVLNRVNKLTLSIGCIEHTHLNRATIVFIVIDHLRWTMMWRMRQWPFNGIERDIVVQFFIITRKIIINIFIIRETFNNTWSSMCFPSHFWNVTWYIPRKRGGSSLPARIQQQPGWWRL